MSGTPTRRGASGAAVRRGPAGQPRQRVLRKTEFWIYSDGTADVKDMILDWLMDEVQDWACTRPAKLKLPEGTVRLAVTFTPGRPTKETPS